jgi:cyclohexanecarboxylate-CoA ligase
VIDGDIRLSFADLTAGASALARGLAATGVGRGDVVAWQLPNWNEAVVCFRAAWLLGAVAAPLHHRSGPQDIARQLDLLGPRVVLAAPDLPGSEVPNAIEVHGNGGYETLGEQSPCSASTPPCDTADWDPVNRSSGHAGPVGPDDRALVLFTSGSSGRPKGVVHTHRSLAHKALTMADVHGLGRQDVVLMPAPLAHVSGLLNGVLLPGATGMAVVLLDRWDPDRALAAIAAERVSFMVGPPTFFRDLLEHPGYSPERVASLRVISCGGTGVTAPFVRQAAAGLGASVKRSYGSTEAPTVTTSHVGDPPERAATTDGRPVGDVELRLTDPTDAQPVAPGEVGELWVRGTELFAGYLGERTGDGPAPDGWFRTGDLATVDAGGWLTVVGRTDDVIIRGGENIAPAEVESVLEAHPAVRRAMTVGLPSDRFGEVPAALVVTDDRFDLDQCAAWFAEQGVARFKTPTQVLTVDALPRLPSGKPDRVAAVTLLTATAARGER